MSFALIYAVSLTSMLKIPAKKSKYNKKKNLSKKNLMPPLGFEPGNLEILGLQQNENRNRGGVTNSSTRVTFSKENN